MENIYQAPESTLDQNTIIKPAPESITKPIKNAVIAGSIVTGLTLALSILAMVNQQLVMGIGQDAIVDGILYLGLTFGVYKKSRVSAIFLFSLFTMSKIYMISESGSYRGILFSLILIYYFFKGILATFEYHKFMKQQNPMYSSNNKWVVWVVTPIAIITLAFVVLGLLSINGYLVSSDVQRGSEVTAENYQQLRESNLINDDETIQLFYSEGLSSILEGGNILTDKRAISYESNGQTIDRYSAFYEEIETVSVASKGSGFEDTLILVEKFSGDSFYILASTENDGDKLFLSTLKQNIPVPEENE